MRGWAQLGGGKVGCLVAIPSVHPEWRSVEAMLSIAKQHDRDHFSGDGLRAPRAPRPALLSATSYDCRTTRVDADHGVSCRVVQTNQLSRRQLQMCVEEES